MLLNRFLRPLQAYIPALCQRRFNPRKVYYVPPPYVVPAEVHALTPFIKPSLLSTLSTRIEPVQLNNIKDNPGARKLKRILGRGLASGRGKRCGRGQKGQKARGRIGIVAFEGGQFPFFRRYKKLPRIESPILKVADKLGDLNLGKLQYWIDLGRIDPKITITMKELEDSAVVKAGKYGVRLVDDGCHLLRTKIRIEVTQVSPMAGRAVEALGGNAIAVYFSRDNLRALRKPDTFRIFPRFEQPQHPLVVDFYAESSNFGYLALGETPTYPAPTARFFGNIPKPFMHKEPPLPPIKMTTKLFFVLRSQEQKSQKNSEEANLHVDAKEVEANINQKKSLDSMAV